MAESAAELREHMSGYVKIGAALLVLTLITVGVALYVDFDSVYMTVFVGLLIASIKGSLVACYFMHLIDEQKMIYWILSITVFFFAVLMLLPYMTDSNSVFH
jgi:cytochrome c oxidase subunit IV